MKLEHSGNEKFFHVEEERIKDEFAAKKIADGKNSFRENLRKGIKELEFDIWSALIIIVIVAIFVMQGKIKGQIVKTRDAIDAFERKAMIQAENLNYFMNELIEEEDNDD